MCPPDPRAGVDPGAPEDDASSEDALETDADVLRQRGDVDALLLLAKAYRAGTLASGRDMKKCYEAYRMAADLGSADAEYAVALFCLNGSAEVPQDLREGTARLRGAAEKGSTPAKVYLGNLYELGIHYKADPEKADVWYRNAARGARVLDEPGTPEHTRALAELGCVRYVLALTSGPASDATSDTDKTRLLQRARAHGHQLKLRDEAALDGNRASFLASAEGTATLGRASGPRESGASASGASAREGTLPDAPASLRAAQSSARTSRAPGADPRTTANDGRAKAKSDPGTDADLDADAIKAKLTASKGTSRAAVAFGAFGYAALFVVTGLAAAYAATLGAHELVARGQAPPLLREHLDRVFPLVLGLFGILPSWLVYRFSALVKAIVAGAATAGAGWVAWSTGKGMFHPSHTIQALAFGLAGFLACLFVLGFLGGTKKKPGRVRETKKVLTK